MNKIKFFISTFLFFIVCSYQSILIACEIDESEQNQVVQNFSQKFENLPAELVSSIFQLLIKNYTIEDTQGLNCLYQLRLTSKKIQENSDNILKKFTFPILLTSSKIEELKKFY
ncbi:MAG: hypothetical protein ACRYGR_08455 [Janthinobacterium lividum]